MNEVVAFFEYNNTKYIISKKDNKKIIFLKNDKNNKITERLSSDEIKIVKKVYDSLLIDKNKSTYIKKININSNKYNLFFDNHSHNYFWLSINNQYNKEDNIFLNFKYNHYPEIVFSNKNINQTSESPKFYTKLVKIGTKIIAVLLSAVITLTTLSGCTIENYQELAAEETISQSITIEGISKPKIILENLAGETSSKYNYDLIKQAIAENANLKEPEKNFLYQLDFIFNENYQYMDLDLVIERLKTLKIDYNQNMSSDSGSYNITDNKISFGTDCFENTKKSTFVHEFCHVLQNNSNKFIDELSIENFTIETMIRLYKEGILEKESFLTNYQKKQYENGEINLNNDEDWFAYLCYKERFSSGYQYYIHINHILSELLPQEVLREYIFNPGNTEILVNALVTIDNQKSLTEKQTNAYQLIESINDLRIYTKKGYFYQKDLTECYDNLNYYYNQLKGVNLNESATSSIYIKSNDEYNIYYDSNINDYLKEYYNVPDKYSYHPKTYLSNVQEKSIIIYPNESGEYQILEIDNELESGYQEYLNEINNNFTLK